MDAQRLDPAKRAQRQLELLQATLNRVHRAVPFYKDRFMENRTEPGEVESLKDIAKLPFTFRSHLADHYPYGLFAVPLRDIVRIHTAPGLGVHPVVSGYTRQDLSTWKEIVQRGLSASGLAATDILQICLDPGLANWGRDYKDAAEVLGASVIPLTSLSLEKQQMVLSDYKTSVLVTTPTFAAQLAAGLSSSGIHPNELALRSLILVGEPLSRDARTSLEETFGLTAWSQYGLSDVPGPAVAFECEEHEGMHVNEDHFLPEIVDPRTREPVAEGEEGELVLTTLTTRAFPLIRFATGDRMRFIQEPCKCGRTLRRVQWLPGRTDDTAVIRGVKVHHDQILSHVERVLGFVPERFKFRAVQDERASMLEVWMGVDDHLFSDEVKVLEGSVQAVSAALSQELGVPVCVRLKETSQMNGRAGWV
ncbi:MAG: AMP-binding protein [Deltaproteobacteria bacterium]|nr:AMP-binding protein [Deltaproteobacteria bacterium]